MYNLIKFIYSTFIVKVTHFLISTILCSKCLLTMNRVANVDIELIRGHVIFIHHQY